MSIFKAAETKPFSVWNGFQVNNMFYERCVGGILISVFPNCDTCTVWGMFYNIVNNVKF